MRRTKEAARQTSSVVEDSLARARRSLWPTVTMQRPMALCVEMSKKCFQVVTMLSLRANLGSGPTSANVNLKGLSAVHPIGRHVRRPTRYGTEARTRRLPAKLDEGDPQPPIAAAIAQRNASTVCHFTRESSHPHRFDLLRSLFCLSSIRYKSRWLHD